MIGAICEMLSVFNIYLFDPSKFLWIGESPTDLSIAVNRVIQSKMESKSRIGLRRKLVVRVCLCEAGNVWWGYASLFIFCLKGYRNHRKKTDRRTQVIRALALGLFGVAVILTALGCTLKSQ